MVFSSILQKQDAFLCPSKDDGLDNTLGKAIGLKQREAQNSRKRTHSSFVFPLLIFSGSTPELVEMRFSERSRNSKFQLPGNQVDHGSEPSIRIAMTLASISAHLLSV